MSTLEMTTLGAPGWIGHSGPNQGTAKEFYAKVLDWKIQEIPMKDGSSYSAIAVGDTSIGGFSPMPEDDGSWTVFVTVSDVDNTVAVAESAGGKVLTPPMDMPGVGRMATLADPQGARFAVITYESMTSQ